MKNLLLLLGINCNLFAGSIVTEEYLDKVAMIESNFNYEAEGDGGKALGAWQMHKAAWDDACDYARMKDFNQYNFWFWENTKKDYKQQAMTPEVSRVVVRYYLKLLEERMKANGRKVTPIGLYMAYNMGYAGASGYDFSHTALFLDKKRRSILARANYILSR